MNAASLRVAFRTVPTRSSACRASSSFRFPHLASLTPSRSYAVSSKQRPRQQEDIPRVVRLVDPKTAELLPPADISTIRAKLEEHEFLQLVSNDPDPIVKIMNRKVLYWKEKEAAKKRKETARDEKEVQLTWGISAADLESKLKNARQALLKGSRVNVVFAPKKGQSLPSPQEREARIQQSIELLADVGKEWKPRAVEKQLSIIYLQGNIPPDRELASTKPQKQRRN